MKNNRMNVFGATVISTIAIGALSFMGGCKSQEILRDRPCVPAPSNQEPSNPPLAAPAVVTPVVVQPVLTPAPAVKLPVAKLAPATEHTVPK